ncbi:HK97 family phage prohead protease [Flagellimonas sp. S174]|uniref:HK97 family phage prohead protease n=1 Tax=Flagellimonas sp. S174 TaxID=3410790 RepID=UPI003BF578CD
MDKQQIRFGQFRADSFNEENRTAEFVISTEKEDTYGTVFKADGWDLGRYAKNPVVTYQHRDWSEDPDMVIGISEVRVENDQLIATIRFEDAEDNEVAEKVFRKVKNNILRGASIRADVHEYHWGNFDDGENPEVLYFTRMDLLAWSIVTVPSNPDTVARNEKSLVELRTAVPKKEQKEDTGQRAVEVDDDSKIEPMSRFEAQLIINENSI